MTLILNRRNAIMLGAAASATGIIGTTPAFAADGDMHDVEKLMNPVGPTNHFLGNMDAKVTVIEYASSTCPHCANFHINTYPQLKSDYIDNGKIAFVLRPFVLNVLDAVVFMLAFKAGETSTEGYYAILDAYLKTQATWAQSSQPRDALIKIALQHGFTEESFDAALTNQTLFEEMEAMREQAGKEFDMSGTPTFYINGKQLSGNQPFENMAKEIDPLLS